MTRPARSIRFRVLSRLLPTLFAAMLVQGMIGYVLVVQPLMRRHAEQFAQLLVDRAHIAQAHPDLIWRSDAPYTWRASVLPFNQSLVAELRERGISAPAVRLGSGGRYWLRWGTEDRWVGYSAQQIVGTSPQGALASWLLIQAIVVVAVALVMERSLVRPIGVLRREVREATQTLRDLGPGRSLGIVELDAMRADVVELSARLRTALDDRTVLLLGLSHELRGPLARLRLRVLDTETLVDVLEIQDAIDQLLIAAQAQRAGPGHSLTLSEVIDGLRSRHREIAFAIREEAATVLRSVNLLVIERICSNLIENARVHGANRSVTCTGIEDAEGWRIVVQDRGPGLGAGSPAGRGGLGIGLAISRLLAEQNGWSLSIADADSGGVEAQLRMPFPKATGNISET